MKKKNSTAKFGIGKKTVAKLNANGTVRIVGGQATGQICFNNSGWCSYSYEYSCYGVCVEKYATAYCDPR